MRDDAKVIHTTPVPAKVRASPKAYTLMTATVEKKEVLVWRRQTDEGVYWVLADNSELGPFQPLVTEEEKRVRKAVSNIPDPSVRASIAEVVELER